MNKFFAWINSGSPAQRNKKRLTCYMIAVVAALLAVSLLTLAIIGIVNAIKSGSVNVNEAETVDPNRGFVTTTFAPDQLHKGDLLIIDELHPYVSEANADVTTKKFSEGRTKVDGNNIYYASNQYFDVNAEAMDALDKMIVDFYNSAKGTDGKLYKDSNIYIADIKYGNTFEFEYYATLKGENGATATTWAKISENQKYTWIFQNAYKYGFVQLYDAPEANTGETQAEDMTHIFRYVGKIHSQIMKDKGCSSLTEYIELLKTTSNKKTFGVSVDNLSYKVYYIASDAELLIPEKYKDSYTVSGNNVDGYIITYCTTETK